MADICPGDYRGWVAKTVQGSTRDGAVRQDRGRTHSLPELGRSAEDERRGGGPEVSIRASFSFGWE